MFAEFLVDSGFEEDFAGGDLGGDADGLAKRAGHAGAHAVCARAAGQRVFADDVEWVDTEFEEEGVFADFGFHDAHASLAGCFKGVVADLDVSLGDELELLVVDAVLFAHFEAGNRHVWRGAYEVVLGVLALAGVGPLEAVICCSFADACHGSKRSAGSL